ncbi:hypothetical protein [Algoriphagus boritolerans]|uniref:hypothetical protein n=1 Tax=Algoriphagus boritolerans TaxID=308111 RepID=UPI000AC95F28
MGGGVIEIDREVFDFKRDFWRIDGSTFTQLPNLPTNSLNSLAFELNGELFLAGGEGVGTRTVWRYSPNAQSWLLSPLHQSIFPTA